MSQHNLLFQPASWLLLLNIGCNRNAIVMASQVVKATRNIAVAVFLLLATLRVTDIVS